MYLCKIPCFSNRISGKGGIPDQNAPTRRLSQRCAAFWVPDQNAPARGFLAQARSAAKAATAARRTPQEGLRATEVWIPDQTSGAQAPYFGGLLGPAVRSAAKAATPPQFALRARGQCPLPVCPSPAGLVHRSVRAQCRGVLRCGPGRVGGACLGKKQVGAGCDMRVPSAQPKAGTLPGGYIRGLPPYVCFLPCFLHKQKTSRPPGRDRASCAVRGTLLKKGKVLHRCTSPTIVWGQPRVQISLEHERLSGGAGFFKGRRPLNALLVPFRASEKGPAARGRTPRILCRRKAAFFLKKAMCRAAAQKQSPHPLPPEGGIPI